MDVTVPALPKNEVTQHNRALIQPIPTTGGMFTQVYLNLVGPLPINRGRRFIMTTVDSYTRWTKALPVHEAAAETVAAAFIARWISRSRVI